MGERVNPPCGVFASYPWQDTYRTAPLSFSPLENEESPTTREHETQVKYVLELFGKSVDFIVAIIGDNNEVKKLLSRLLNKPLIGCASHKFALTIINFLLPYEAAIATINDLMGKLKGKKLGGKLRSSGCQLAPQQMNITRWSSTFNMVKRYMEMKASLQSTFTTETSIMDFLLNPREDNDIGF